MKDFEKMVSDAIRLIRSVGNGGVIEVAYSGGKDSDVILDLVKRSGVEYRAIYRCTTVDPPGTIKHALDNGVEIRRPRKSYLELIRQKGMPTRRCRFCCEVLKEYKILDVCVQGIRRCESVSRQKRYDAGEPVVCRLYGRNRQNHVNVVLPILNWENEDVERYIKEHGIKCHETYYNERGDFVVANRLGCLTCPLQGDNGLGDFMRYPRFVRAVIRNLELWWKEHPNTKCHEKFKDAYELFIHNVFSRTYVQHKKFVEKEIPGGDYRCYLERYFSINLHFEPKVPDAESFNK